MIDDTVLHGLLLFERLVDAVERLAKSAEEEGAGSVEGTRLMQEINNAQGKRYDAEETLRRAQYEHMAVCEKLYLKRIAEGGQEVKPVKR